MKQHPHYGGFYICFDFVTFSVTREHPHLSVLDFDENGIVRKNQEIYKNYTKKSNDS